jgi:hypothetical protein
MNEYDTIVESARRRGRAAFEAMNAWLDRPFDAPNDTPPRVLEEWARALRDSRASLLELIERYGERDDLMEALKENAAMHAGVGLRLDPNAEEEP